MTTRARFTAREAGLTEEIRVYAPPQLKELAFQAAEAAGLPLTEWVVRAMAEKLQRPDLSIITRLRRGPKPKKKQTMAS